eukprot:8005061-Pyramimonas_sp.AAC.1
MRPSGYVPGIALWEHDEHEVAYSWLQAFNMWPGNGVVLGTRIHSQFTHRRGSRLRLPPYTGLRRSPTIDDSYNIPMARSD